MWAIGLPVQADLLGQTAVGTNDPSKHPNSNFWKMCRWSPDGTCLLGLRDDDKAQTFPLPSQAAAASLKTGTEKPRRCTLTPSLSVHLGESVYDIQWYPACNFMVEQTACFAHTGRCKPVALWDACTGNIRCTYRTYDHADEVTACRSIHFHNDCTRLLGGLKNKVAVWHVAKPGRDHDEMDLNLEGKAGIVSCMDVSMDGEVLAAGTFSGILPLCDLRSFDCVAWIRGHRTGVTKVQFSGCGNFLYTRARKDSNIYCWDVRNTLSCLYSLEVPEADTNQRLPFDIESYGRHMVAGSTAGSLAVFDLATAERVSTLSMAADTVSGVHLHGTLPMMATCSGHRRFWDHSTQNWSEDMLPGDTNTLRLWKLRSQEIVPEGNALGGADEPHPEAPS